MYEGAAWLYEFIIHARWQCTAHWAKDRLKEPRPRAPIFSCPYRDPRPSRLHIPLKVRPPKSARDTGRSGGVTTETKEKSFFPRPFCIDYQKFAFLSP